MLGTSAMIVCILVSIYLITRRRETPPAPIPFPSHLVRHDDEPVSGIPIVIFRQFGDPDE